MVYNSSKSADVVIDPKDKYLTNFLDTLGEDADSSTDTLGSSNDVDANEEEKKVLDKVGEALARLGRVKRVGLTLKDKSAFIEAWTKRRK